MKKYLLYGDGCTIIPQNRYTWNFGQYASGLDKRLNHNLSKKEDA